MKDTKSFTLEEFLESESHTLDIGYDSHFQCWTAHLSFPSLEEGPEKGYTDGLEGRGESPSGAMDSLLEAVILRKTGGCRLEKIFLKKKATCVKPTKPEKS